MAIDDSPAILSLITDVLSSHNHAVQVAKSGLEGIEKYADFKPDIVTVDLAMPEMDGYETLVRLKSMDKYANVIIITATDSSAALKRCLQEGALSFIPKPFTTNELLNAVIQAADNTKYCSHDALMFFSLLGSRLSIVFAKAFGSDVYIEVKDIRAVKNIEPAAIKTATAESVFEKASLEGNVCFITQITGGKESLVASLIKETDLDLLFALDKSLVKQQVADSVLEFFNIVNTKVVSELAESTRLPLEAKPVMFFSKPDKMMAFWNQTARMWNRMELAFFDILGRDRVIPFAIYVWYDGELFT